MRGVKTMTGLRVIATGHAFVQNLRRGHYEIAADQPGNLRLAIAFGQLATANWASTGGPMGSGRDIMTGRSRTPLPPDSSPPTLPLIKNLCEP
jgi:hypothetical protein